MFTGLSVFRSNPDYMITWAKIFSIFKLIFFFKFTNTELWFMKQKQTDSYGTPVKKTCQSVICDDLFKATKIYMHTLMKTHYDTPYNEWAMRFNSVWKYRMKEWVNRLLKYEIFAFKLVEHHYKQRISWSSKTSTKKFPYGETSVRRTYFTAEYRHGEISCGEISSR